MKNNGHTRQVYSIDDVHWETVHSKYSLPKVWQIWNSQIFLYILSNGETKGKGNLFKWQKGKLHESIANF